MTKTKNQIPMVTATGLKERGWTGKLIKDFAGTHDSTYINSYRKESKLYILDKIQKIEKTIDFISAKEKTAKRKESAKKAIETKQEKLLKMIEEFEIDIIVLPDNELIESTIENYNGYRVYNGFKNFEPASKKSDFAFLQRIIVNFIRHELTSYEENLYDIFGRVGKKEGVDLIRQKIYDEIAKKYPKYKDECNRQREKRSI